MNILKKKIISLCLVFSISAGSVSTCSGFSWNIFNFWKKKSPVKTSSVNKNIVLTFTFGILFFQIFTMALSIFLRRRRNNGGSDEREPGLPDLRPACGENDLGKVKRILDKNKEDTCINIFISSTGTEHEKSVLWEACENGNLELVRLLVDAVNLERRGSVSGLRGSAALLEQSILDVVCERGHDEIFKVLVRKEVSSGIDYKEQMAKHPLHVACAHGKMELVRWLVEEMNFDVNETDRRAFRFTALHKASENGHLEIVRYLISRGANPRSNQVRLPRYSRALPVHLACENGHLDVVKYFVEECGIEVDAIDLNGCSLIFYACKSNNLDLIKWLAPRCKALINKKAWDVKFEKTGTRSFPGLRWISDKREEILSSTPLDMARQKGNNSIVQELLKHGGNVLNVPKEKIKQPKEKTKQKEKKPKLGKKKKQKKSKINLKDLNNLRMKRKQQELSKKGDKKVI
ncbi:ankyrin repeat domain-containing protein [Candidatus Dependentiae bacterium]